MQESPSFFSAGVTVSEVIISTLLRGGLGFLKMKF